jgi:hypothetical protein
MSFTDELRDRLRADPRPQSEIAKLAGFTEAAISLFKAGKKEFSAESLDRLAGVLGAVIVVKDKPRKRRKA